MHIRLGVTDNSENPIARDALVMVDRVIFTDPLPDDRARARWGIGEVVALPVAGEVVSRANGVAVIVGPAEGLLDLLAEVPDPLVIVVVTDDLPAGLPSSPRLAIIHAYAGCCFSISCRFGAATVTELSRRADEPIPPEPDPAEEAVAEEPAPAAPVAEENPIPARLRKRRDRRGSSK